MKQFETLFDKNFYVCHLTNIKFNVEHGQTVTKVHRDLQFDQSGWLRTSILKNRIVEKYRDRFSLKLLQTALEGMFWQDNGEFENPYTNQAFVYSDGGQRVHTQTQLF